MKTSEEARAALAALTKKQLRVVEMLAHGLDAPEIAAVMSLSEYTIRFHRHSAYKALGIKKAVQLGVIVGMASLVTDWRGAA